MGSSVREFYSHAEKMDTSLEKFQNKVNTISPRYVKAERTSLLISEAIRALGWKCN